MAEEVLNRRPRGGVQLRRARPTAWSAKRRTTFLETLAASCNVAASAREAGLSQSLVYRQRRLDPGFRAEWAQAIRQAVDLLEMRMLERALHGVTRPVFSGGKQIGEITEYDDGRALQLLKMHRDEARAAEAMIDTTEEDERTLAALTDQFRTMRDRLTLPKPEAGPE